MNLYIHCHVCYVQPKRETERTFSISSCGKLICSEKCLTAFQKIKCNSCEKCNVILFIDAPSHVQEFFSNVDELLQKSTKIMEYQNKLRDRMFKYVSKRSNAYGLLKAEFVKLQTAHSDLRKDYKRLQEHFKRMTPFPPSGGSRAESTASSRFVDFPLKGGAANKKENVLSFGMSPTPPFLKDGAKLQNFIKQSTYLPSNPKRQPFRGMQNGNYTDGSQSGLSTPVGRPSPFTVPSVNSAGSYCPRDVRERLGRMSFQHSRV